MQWRLFLLTDLSSLEPNESEKNKSLDFFYSRDQVIEGFVPAFVHVCQSLIKQRLKKNSIYVIQLCS